jgi:IS5 family transposase
MSESPVKSGLPPWGPHVRFRRVQTLVREAVRWSRSAILHSAKRSPAISRGGAENQIIVDYEVYARRPNDSDLLIPSIAAHQAKLGRVPRLLATDAGFYSARNEAAAKAMGVKRVCIPNRSSKSIERKREQKKRWFRNGQKWRTGCEGRISVVKRRNGLDRCRYKGDDGMQRWVGLGVISDNLVNIGRAMGKQAAP